jgi:hypothetical protein
LTIDTTDVTSLTVTTPSTYAGAEVLQVSESWLQADGTMATMTIATMSKPMRRHADLRLVGRRFPHRLGGRGPVRVLAAIGNDMVYSFDAAADQIDLIGYAASPPSPT